jgi:hypothetical protein
MPAEVGGSSTNQTKHDDWGTNTTAPIHGTLELNDTTYIYSTTVFDGIIHISILGKSNSPPSNGEIPHSERKR